jgi:hypothetical protein
LLSQSVSCLSQLLTQRGFSFGEAEGNAARYSLSGARCGRSYITRWGSQARAPLEVKMDRDTKATLRRIPAKTVADRMTSNGRIEDLVRQFKVLPKATRREYSIMVGETQYGPDEIENFAREFGIEER